MDKAAICKWVHEVIHELREPTWKLYGLMQNDYYIAMNEKSMAMMEEVFGTAPKDVYEPYLYGIPIRTKKDIPDGQVFLIHEEPVFKYIPTKLIEEERYVFDEE